MSILSTVKTFAGVAVRATKKHSPTILLVAGIGGLLAAGTGAVIVAAKKEPKIQKDYPCYNKKPEDIIPFQSSDVTEKCSMDVAEKVKEDKKAVRIERVKMYGPFVLIAVLSTSSLVMSHVILKKRYAALATAYSALALSFAEYRKRVKDALGEDKEREIYLTSSESENKEITESETKHISPTINPYVRRFNKDCRGFYRNRSHTLDEIKLTLAHLNDLLRIRPDGIVTFNEALETYGFDKVDYGQLTGWVRQSSSGDDKIDIRLDDTEVEKFLNYEIDYLTFDFNVDGEILYSYKKQEDTAV